MFAFTACINEDTGWGGVQQMGSEEVGYLYFGEGGLQVAVDQEVGAGDVEPGAAARPSLTRASEAADGSYTIQIFDAAGTKVQEFAYGDLQSKYTTDNIEGNSVTGIKLPVGKYTIKAFSAPTPNYSATPQYEAAKQVTIAKGKQSNVELVCKLSSVKVTVTFDPIMADVIEATSTSVLVRLDEEGIEEANRSQYTYTGYADKAALTASHDTVTPIYLKPQAPSEEGNSPLNLYLSTLYGKQLDAQGNVLQEGTQISLQKLFVANACAGEWRKVTIKLDHGTEGTVYFEVEVATWVYNELIDVTQATYAVSGTIVEGEIPDVTDAPKVEWVGGDIAEPLTLTEEMFENGAYKGNVNILVSTKQPIKKIYLAATSDNSSLNGSFTDMGMVATADSYGLDLTVVTGTSEIVLNSWGFPVGASIAGVKELSFDLAGLMTSLQKSYQGNHTFSLTVVDEKNNTSTTTLSVTSGVEPETSVIWPDHDMSVRYEMNEELKMNLDIYAKGGVKNLFVEIGGTLGPEVEKVGIPLSFDLTNPGKLVKVENNQACKNDDGTYIYTDEDLATVLQTFGFPTGDAVIGKKKLPFDISGFKSMLKVFGGATADFNVRVVDNNGGEASGSIKIQVP